MKKSGWWLSPTPLKNIWVKVNWDDFPFPTEWNVIIHSMVPSHQAEMVDCLFTGTLGMIFCSPKWDGSWKLPRSMFGTNVNAVVRNLLMVNHQIAMIFMVGRFSKMIWCKTSAVLDKSWYYIHIRGNSTVFSSQKSGWFVVNSILWLANLIRTHTVHINSFVLKKTTIRNNQCFYWSNCVQSRNYSISRWISHGQSLVVHKKNLLLVMVIFHL